MSKQADVKKYAKWLWDFGPVVWVLAAIILFAMVVGVKALAYICLVVVASAIAGFAFTFGQDLIRDWFRSIPDWWEERPWRKK